MSWFRRLFPLVVATCACLLLLAAAAPAAGGDLILRGPESRTAASRPAAPEIVQVDASVLAAAPEVLWLEPVAGAGRWAYRTDLERSADGHLVWRGRFAEDDPSLSTVTLTLHDGVVVGTLAMPDGVIWFLRPRAAGGWELRADDPADFECGTPAPDTVGVATGRNEPPPPEPDPEIDKSVAAAEERVVYVLVLYTPRAAARIGAGVIEASARHNVDALNSALANSGIDGRVGLAAAVRADLGFPGDMNGGEALGHSFRHPVARELQDRWRADIVTVVVDSSFEVPSVCGYANVMFRSMRGPQMADVAYNVIGEGCFVSSIFTHETGHVFGAQHDPENASSPQQAAFPFSFAHGVDDHFRTVMSYPSACQNCNQLTDVFSNPLRSIDGVPTGVADNRDNALTLNLNFPLVASFRTGRPPAPPPAAPAAPTDLAATALSPTEVSLTWTDRAGNETGFQVESTVAAAESWQRVADLPADTTAHTVGGLQPDTAYRFRVRAVRDGAASAFGPEAAATTPPAVPETPAGLAAEASSASAITLRWDAAERATGYEVELRTADPAADRGPAPVVHAADGAVVDGLEPATPYTVRVRAVNEHGPSPWSAPASVTTGGPAGPCVAGGATLCLLDGRFEVRAHWRNPRPPFGHGLAAAAAAPGSGRTGLFTFFNPANVELVVKMLDGRAVNGAHWLFYGALSDVEYWISARDTESGALRTYHNPPRELCGRGDTGAFADDPDAPAPAPAVAAPLPVTAVTADAGGECGGGPDSLCLAGGRFRVEVTWEDPRVPDSRGSGHVYAGLDGDLSGSFWFFRPDNLELAVKILDGRAVNGHHWIFWGGLTDVGFTLRVTDTDSGAVHEFENAPRTLCGGAVTDRL